MPVEFMHALSELRIFVGKELCSQALVFRLTGFTSVLGAIHSGRGNRNMHSLYVAGIEDDRVKTHAASAWLPLRPVRVIEQSAYERPASSSVIRLEQCRRL